MLRVCDVQKKLNYNLEEMEDDIVADKKMMNAFADRLRSCRIAGGYETAADLAAALNLSDYAYRRYERGEALPPYDRLDRIAQLTNVDFRWLATGNK